MCIQISVSPYSAIPESALNEEETDDEDEDMGEARDDERSGTRYNVRFSFRFLLLSLTMCPKVRLVPHHLRHRGHVRRNAAYRLVCLFPFRRLISTITIFFFPGMSSLRPRSLGQLIPT